MSDINIAVQRLFKTDDGKLLLKYLDNKYYDNRVKSEELERQVGRRDVVLDIKQLIRNQK